MVETFYIEPRGKGLRTSENNDQYLPKRMRRGTDQSEDRFRRYLCRSTSQPRRCSKTTFNSGYLRTQLKSIAAIIRCIDINNGTHHDKSLPEARRRAQMTRQCILTKCYCDDLYCKFYEEDSRKSPPQNQSPTKTTFPKWKKGDECFAKYWEDKKFHRATVKPSMERWKHRRGKIQDTW